MREILKSKRALRQRLAARSVAEKLRLLEVLRDRTLAIGAARKRTISFNAEDLVRSVEEVRDAVVAQRKRPQH